MKSGALIAAVLLCCVILDAQDADTILLKNDERKFAIVSQIKDPAEASRFVAVLGASDSGVRYELATNFLRDYSKSWLLPQVSDLLARSALDLDKYDEALTMGRFSLRLLPENPALLILMANLEAQKKDYKRAVTDSSDALEYLSQIERPPNLTQSEWNAVRPKLKASAFFARARAEAASGMAARSAKGLRDAFDDLNTAASWNSEDTEVFYLRAIVEIELQQKMVAASDLAYVLETDSPLREKAKSLLAILCKGLSPEGTSLEAFLKRVGPPAVDAELRREHVQPDNRKTMLSGYAGPEACKSCHEKEYAAWRKTGMARMLQAYRPENVIGDFSQNEYAEGQDVIRLGSEKRPFFEIRTLGTWSRYYVDFTIGSKWQQAYATKLPDGRLQVLPIEYNLLQKKWVNYWKMIDPPGSSRANIGDFAKLSSATNYQQNCAICHTSQLKADVTAADSMEHATYLQPGIDCEMCHGPSALHVKRPEERPLNFRTVSNREGVRVCAQCHRQSAVREIGEGGEMNYSKQKSFIPATWLRPYDAFSRKAFYKDGRFRETTFIVEAFTRSACYRRGAAQCASCHSPHLGDFETNQTSLKSKANPNEMCLGCHSEFRNRVSEHSRHAVNSEASQCVTCHMPRIMNALLFKARSHQIETPSADLTERFGQEESPNVCLTCHSEQDAGWAKEQLTAWVR